MTLDERAKEFVSKIASGTSQEMDYYANLLVEFANETTKELQEDLKHKKIAIQNRKTRIKELEAQIEKMKSDVKQLREDRMNDDTDQNIMDRLWEEWTVNFGVSN